MAGEVFSGKLIRVRVDEQGLELVSHPPAVVMVAVDERGRVWLVRSPRPVPERTLIEVPAGLVEPEESPDAAARRELLEECGVEAGRWEKLASAYSSPGFSDERIHVYLATELREVSSDPSTLEIEERVQASLDEALVLCSGNLQSLAALLLARRRLAVARPEHPG